MKKYEWALFDLDGTITDPYEGITGCVKYACEKLNIEIPCEETLRLFIGPPLVDSFKRYCHLSEEKAIEALWLYRERYNVIGIDANVPYEGIDVVLKTLKEKGVKISLATSKPEEYSVIILKNNNLLQYFDFIAGNDLKESRPKKTDVLKYAITNGKIDPSKSVMIGDRKFDICGGRELGFDTIGVLYGYGSEEEIKENKTDYIATTPRKILDYFV